MLVQTLVMPHFDYCDILLTDLSVISAQRLQRVHDMCVRFVCNIRRADHSRQSYAICFMTVTSYSYRSIRDFSIVRRIRKILNRSTHVFCGRFVRNAQTRFVANKKRAENFVLKQDFATPHIPQPVKEVLRNTFGNRIRSRHCANIWKSPFFLVNSVAFANAWKHFSSVAGRGKHVNKLCPLHASLCKMLCASQYSGLKEGQPSKTAAVASRDKKKTLMFLLPLISFFHLKALLVPILLAVLFIKKLLVLGVVFLPSLLSLVKWCKPMHHHHVPWYPEPEPPIDYHSEYSPHYGKEYATRRRSREVRRNEAQDLAFRGNTNTPLHAIVIQTRKEAEIKPEKIERLLSSLNQTTETSENRNCQSSENRKHHKSRHTGHGDHAVTYSEDHHVAPDENRESWSGRNHYPGRGDKPSWNSHKHDSGAQTEGPPKQGWGDPIMSPAVMVTPTLDTEVTAGSSAGSSSFGVDEIRGSWGTSKRRNSVSRYTDREDSDTWGSGRHAEDEGRMSSYKAPLTNHNWDTKPAKTLEKDIGETLRQSWGRDQPDATGRGWNDDDTSADSDNTQRYHYTWSRDKGHSRPEKPRAGWGGTSDDSNVEETVDEVNIWPEVRNSKKYDSSITTEEVANNVGAPRERVGDSQTTPSDTRVVNQTNRPTGERRKKKCDNKEIPASTSNAERDADKISPITKPEISGNYSVLKNHRL
ncbi:hypothetical protein ANN_02385 [Periplaneta americana]|uniref:Uncharacterized protein n=1 Tax=Periplaneta americana TaxID=6978 RepID=A0ABQ8TZD8_PERAM|nr:hypothetical protein ANN_02385 [Periplaneta americana]